MESSTKGLVLDFQVEAMRDSPVTDEAWNEFMARKIEYMSWKKWFAWYPVKIHGKRTWLKTVYRRKIITYVDTHDWARYEYGTIFNVLTN